MTDGSGFLLSWIHLHELNTPRFELRLDSLGQPVAPFARQVEDYRGYASTGDGDYLAIWQDDQYFWVQRVNADGEPAGPPNPVLGHGGYYGIYGLFANRNCYLLLVSVGDPAHFIAILVDRIGRVIQQRALGIAFNPDAAPYDGGFVIAGCTGFSPCTPQLSTLSNSGRLTRLAVPGLPPTILWDMRASDDRLMITWWEKVGVARFMILGFDGNVLKPPFPVPIPAESLPAGLLWDGREFLLLLREMGNLIGTLRAIRVNGNGDRLNEPYLLSETASSSPLFATNETTGLLIWSDTRFSSEPDVVGLRLRHFSELADSLDRATLISRSPTAQSAVQLASSGSHLVAVWTNEPSHTISGSIDGTEFNVTNAARREVDLPAVAASPNGFVVAWNEFSSTDEGSLFVRRYAWDGTPLDDEPVEIFERVPRSSLRSGGAWGWSTVHRKPSLLYDGISFVLFEGNAFTMRIARIDPLHGAVTTSSLPLPAYTSGILRPIPTPAGWYVPYTRKLGILVSGQDATISIATIDPDGAMRNFETPFFCEPGTCTSFSAAYAQGKVTQLFTPHAISLWRSTPAGESLGQPIDISDRGNVVANDIVWNGSEYVAAWILNTGLVRVRRFAADGQPLDSEPFTIATDAEARAPSIAVIPSGVVIAYSRHDDASAGVPRAFTRTLARLGR